MAIHRYAPGERPIAGTYALVGHYGEATGFAVQVREGEQLPFVAVTGFGPLWFVRVDEPSTAAEAA